MIETATTIAQQGATFAASLLMAVAGFGGIAFAGAWLKERKTPCNPYGISGCDCCADVAHG